VAAWLGAALSLDRTVRSASLAAAAFVLVGTVAFMVRRGPRGTVVGLAALCAAGGIAAATFRVAAVHSGPLPDLARRGAAVTLDVVLTGDPKVVSRAATTRGQEGDLVAAAPRAERVDAGGEPVAVRSPVVLLAKGEGWSGLLPSQRLRLDGKLLPPRPGELVAAAVDVRGPPRDVTAPSTLHRQAGTFRAGLQAAVEPLPAAQRGLLAGMADGDTSRLLPGVAEDFRATSLTHLVAVSGTHVAIVLGAVLMLARWVRCGPRLQALIGVLGLLGYAVVSRPGPSVLRATAMGLLTLAALASGRQRRALPALCAAVLVVVYVDPTLARTAGFAMSVLATAGLIVVAPVLRDRMARRMPRWLAEAIALPASASLMCAPIIVAISGRVSVVSIPANLLAAPAVAPATLLGVLAAAVSTFWLTGAHFLAWLGSIPCTWLLAVSHVGARLPGATFGWRSGMAGGLMLAAATVILLLILPRRRLRHVAAAGCAGLLVAAGSLRVIAPAWPPPGWVLVACDVGQGDGLVLHAGRGAGIVVDAGPDPDRIDRCLSDLGVRRVPLVVLTHLHADHVEGLPGVLRGRSVAQIQVGPLDEPPAQWERVRTWAAEARVPFSRAAAGEERAIADLRWRVIAPQLAFRGTSSDPNNSSLVLHVRAPGATILLTGDVEPPGQDAILESGEDLRADVIKVPHHGSRHQNPAFLGAVGARVAITSVGAKNDYGHPSPRTLDELQARGARSMRTDLDGDIAVLGRDSGGDRGGKGLRVVGRHGAGTTPNDAAFHQDLLLRHTAVRIRRCALACCEPCRRRHPRSRSRHSQWW
jgi:competence protein ComEC